MLSIGDKEQVAFSSPTHFLETVCANGYPRICQAQIRFLEVSRSGMSRINGISSRGASASAPFMADSHRQGRHISSFSRCHLNQQNLHGEASIEVNYQPAKVKRVTAPLNEAVRAMLCGNCAGDAPQATLPRAAATPVYGTSGSDHGVDSATLSDMRFLEEEEGGGAGEEGDCADCESHAESSTSQDKLPVSEGQLYQTLEGILFSSTKLEESLLLNVTKALGKAGLSTQTESHRHEKNYLRRIVMSSLRSAGYNAAVCKTRWEQTNGHPPGDYEFIDVMVEVEASSSKPINAHRLFVDIDFRAQFEIARPTAEYAGLVELLPTLWLGSADKLRDVIKIMCDAAKRSLKAKGMHLPPWRKYRYSQAKWLGHYKRTTNPLPSCQPLLLNGFSEIAAQDAAFPRRRELHFERAATVREGDEAEKEQEAIANANYRLQSCAGVAVPRTSSRKQPARIPGLTTALAAV